jgi:hypothetical protein
MAGKDAEIWTFRSEKVRKFELCTVIFYVGKSAESWTLLFLLAKKVFRAFSDIKNDKVQISALFPT